MYTYEPQTEISTRGIRICTELFFELFCCFTMLLFLIGTRNEPILLIGETTTTARTILIAFYFSAYNFTIITFCNSDPLLSSSTSSPLLMMILLFRLFHIDL